MNVCPIFHIPIIFLTASCGRGVCVGGWRGGGGGRDFIILPRRLTAFPGLSKIWFRFLVLSFSAPSRQIQLPPGMHHFRPVFDDVVLWEEHVGSYWAFCLWEINAFLELRTVKWEYLRVLTKVNFCWILLLCVNMGLQVLSSYDAFLSDIWHWSEFFRVAGLLTIYLSPAFCLSPRSKVQNEITCKTTCATLISYNDNPTDLKIWH